MKKAVCTCTEVFDRPEVIVYVIVVLSRLIAVPSHKLSILYQMYIGFFCPPLQTSNLYNMPVSFLFIPSRSVCIHITWLHHLLHLHSYRAHLTLKLGHYHWVYLCSLSRLQHHWTSPLIAFQEPSGPWLNFWIVPGHHTGLFLSFKLTVVSTARHTSNDGESANTSFNLL